MFDNSSFSNMITFELPATLIGKTPLDFHTYIAKRRGAEAPLTKRRVTASRSERVHSSAYFVGQPCATIDRVPCATESEREYISWYLSRFKDSVESSHSSPQETRREARPPDFEDFDYLRLSLL